MVAKLANDIGNDADLSQCNRNISTCGRFHG